MWLGWNFLAPPHLRFDPPTGFVLWLFISNAIQLLLMPLLLVGQTLQGKYSERLAQSDYEINMKAQREIDAVLAYLAQQQVLLKHIAGKLGTTEEELAQVLAEFKT
jgi:uncharacterized membrane protein